MTDWVDERAERAERNNQVIAEFRANEGLVGGSASTLLLHHTGAKSGIARVNPVAFQRVGENFAIFGSRAGGPLNPDWYHNLIANPQTSIEVGSEIIEVVARVTSGEERAAIWERQKADSPGFAAYEAKTTREIPVILLERT